MNFKIDTKDSYSLILPLEFVLNAKMAEDIGFQCAQLRQNGRPNYIVDFSSVAEADAAGIEALTQLHDDIYGLNESLVLTGINNDIMRTVKDAGLLESLNIAPKMIEAIDIVSMEILERDLFAEE